MKCISIIRTAPVLAALSMTGFAQNSDVNPTGDFTIERVLTLNSVISPLAPNFPPPVLAGLQDGSLEVHQFFIYKSAQRTVEQLAIVVPGKSPVPFPSPASAPVADHYIIQVDRISTTTRPGPAAVVVGHVTSNDAPTPWGDITGTQVTISFGYSGSGAATQFGPIYESVNPVYGLYTATGAGSLNPTPSQQACSNATLNGTYLFRLNGASLGSDNSWTPYAESGRFTADGQGNITVHDTGSIAGRQFLNRTFHIDYALDETCTGTFKFAGGSQDVQVSLDGRQVNLVFTSPSYVVANGSGSLQ